MTGRIFDIQRFSLQDGPGIRTAVFLKGCNLRCPWCHNPESVSPAFELQWYPSKCAGCGRCAVVCPHGAITTGEAGMAFDRALCDGCGSCAAVCFSGARLRAGRDASAEETMEEILKDRPYYDISGGGVTFTGGEPMLQRGFLMEILERCREEGIHTALETAGNVPWEEFEGLAGLVGLYLCDVKHVDGEKHREATGAGTGLIQGNLERLLARGERVWVRIPVIPGFNADAGSMEAIAARLSALKGIERLEFLPFHALGESKCVSLGIAYAAGGLIPPSPDELRERAAIFLRYGLAVEYAGRGRGHDGQV